MKLKLVCVCLAKPQKKQKIQSFFDKFLYSFDS